MSSFYCRLGKCLEKSRTVFLFSLYAIVPASCFLALYPNPAVCAIAGCFSCSIRSQCQALPGPVTSDDGVLLAPPLFFFFMGLPDFLFPQLLRNSCFHLRPRWEQVRSFFANLEQAATLSAPTSCVLANLRLSLKKKSRAISCTYVERLWLESQVRSSHLRRNVSQVFCLSLFCKYCSFSFLQLWSCFFVFVYKYGST